MRQRNLPKNLYSTNKNGVIYYRYKSPFTGKFAGFGTDKKQAVEVAIQCNAEFMQQYGKGKKQVLMQAAKGIKQKKIKDLVPEFLEEKREQWKAKTLKDQCSRLKNIEEKLGHMLPEYVKTQHITEFLHDFSPAQAKMYRSLLNAFFKFCAQQGYTEQNPVEKTATKKFEKQRERLSQEEFFKIYNRASPHLKTAMKLSYYTALRQSDCLKMKWCDIRDGSIFVEIKKTGKRIKINIASFEGLADFLQQIERQGDHVVSHKGQAVRDSAVQYEWRKIREGITGTTFHEIRSLAGRILEEKGRDKKDIQALYGHSSETMTDHYLDNGENEFIDVG